VASHLIAESEEKELLRLRRRREMRFSSPKAKRRRRSAEGEAPKAKRRRRSAEGASTKPKVKTWVLTLEKLSKGNL